MDNYIQREFHWNGFFKKKDTVRQSLYVTRMYKRRNIKARVERRKGSAGEAKKMRDIGKKTRNS